MVMQIKLVVVVVVTFYMPGRAQHSKSSSLLHQVSLVNIATRYFCSKPSRNLTIEDCPREHDWFFKNERPSVTENYW